MNPQFIQPIPGVAGLPGLGAPLAIHLSPQARPDRQLDGVIVDGPIALLPVSGVIGKHLAWWASYEGRFDTAKLEAWVLGLMSRSDISTVVLVANSPGGSAWAAHESALLLRELAGAKRTVGFIDQVAASAMYWVISACDEIYATPGAAVGSIGIIREFTDVSAAYEAAGMKKEIFASGEMKWIGSPGTALTDGQRAFLEGDLAEWSAKFTDFVTSRRQGLDAALFDGRWFSADASLSAGLIDGIYPTLAHFLGSVIDPAPAF